MGHIDMIGDMVSVMGITWHSIIDMLPHTHTFDYCRLKEN